MITHAYLAWKNHAQIGELDVTSDDVGLACGPLYHVGALDLVTTTMIAVGATTVVHRTFDPVQVVDEIERSRVTCIWAAPAMVRAILDVHGVEDRSEEHQSELQSLMRISYAVFCLKKQK